MKNTGKHDYDFRARDLTVTGKLSPTPNAATPAGCRITDSWEIVAQDSGSKLSAYFTYDLCRFLADGFGIYIRVRRTADMAAELASPENKIILYEDETAVGSDMAAAYRIEITPDFIRIAGRTERGAAQGTYYLEEQLRMRGDAGVECEDSEHAPLFSPRMTHSGFGLDSFPDKYLEAVAHSGMDSIIVYSGHPDMCIAGFEDPDALWPGTGRSYCDFNDLVRRAEGFGLNVYVYSHYKCDVHPDDPGAADYYEASFGKLFRDCPGLKGIIFVGECFEFPSKDEHTSGIRCQLKDPSDRRPSPGWYPCSDYPKLVTLVRDTIRRYNPDADIVFWTYNWGYAGREARLELIENLPRDISLLVTFEMWETFGDGHRIDDYSISFPGPSRVFTSEAEKARQLGIRLYAMSNTGGRTWDSGAAPYLPVPQQWIKRYEALREAHERYGLAGLMEDHHYGWLPSFLTQLSRNAFMTGAVPDGVMLERTAKRDWGTEYAAALTAWQLFSDGISEVIAANVDQYGPYRSGPTYPLLWNQDAKEIDIPSVPWAMHKGGAIWNPIYPDDVIGDPESTLFRLDHVKTAESRFTEGLDLLEGALSRLGAGKGSEISRQTAVARFLRCTYSTAANVIEWQIAKKLFERRDNCESLPDSLFSALGLSRPEKRRGDCGGSVGDVIRPAEYSDGSLNRYVGSLAERLRGIAGREIANTRLALTCWEEDSSIGFEPSMEYVFNDRTAEWKIRQTGISLERIERDVCSIQF